MVVRAQAVDPTVSHAKFDREVELFRSLQEEHQRRGWWLLRAQYPEVFIAFATPQVRPPVVVFGALLDFTDYDFRPPSVRMADPFTRVPYHTKDLPTVLKRSVPPSSEVAGLFQPGVMLAAEQPMMQGLPEEIPFLCLPGVREYHEHPAHTGDNWLLHRGGAEGTLNFILDVLYRYGVQPINGFQIGLQVTGFRQGPPPQ